MGTLIDREAPRTGPASPVSSSAGARDWTLVALLPLVLSVVFTAALILACAIPQSAIESHARRSGAEMVEHGGYPRAFHIDSKAHQIDGFTDATMLNVAYEIDASQPLHAAMIDSQSTTPYDLRTHLPLGRIVSSDSLERLAYPRYWHGYLTYVRPLLVVADWNVMLVLLSALLLALTVMVLARSPLELGLPMVAGMLLTNLAVAVQCLQLVHTYVIAMALTLWVVRSRPGSMLEDARRFVIAGGVTAFLDLLSAPIMTLGLPLLFLVHRLRDEGRLGGWTGGLKRIALCSIGWGYAYVACWGIKWLLASAVTGTDVVADAFSQIALRAGPTATNVSQMVDQLVGFAVPVRISAPLVNLGAMLEFDNRTRLMRNLAMWAVILVVLLAVWLRFRRRNVDRDLQILLLVVAASPIAWYVLTAGHAARHYWFTYRGLVVTIAALGCAWAHAVDWSRVTGRGRRLMS